MKKTKQTEWNQKTIQQVIAELHEEADKEWLLWDEELSGDFIPEVEFLLVFKWWSVLCHVLNKPPYSSRCRLMGEALYTKCKPWELIWIAKQKLLH